MKKIFFALALLFGSSAFAQSFTNTPPPLNTNIVRLTASTRLVWNASPTNENVVGYFVTATIPATNRLFTTNAFLPVNLLTPTNYTGPFRATVSAVNADGLESDPSTPLDAVVGTPPSVIVNLTVQIVVE